MKIKISTPVYPTEDSSKILKALERYFSEVKFKVLKKEIKGESGKLSCLDLLKEKIIAKQIKNTVRYLMLEYKKPNSSRLLLNKQALVSGKINFVEESYPLGNVEIEIETENLENVLDYLTGITFLEKKA